MIREFFYFYKEKNQYFTWILMFLIVDKSNEQREIFFLN